MTIAITGNKIVDQQARLGKAKGDAEARRQGRVAKRSAKTGSTRVARRHKSNVKARAGRKALKSTRGRGIAGSVHKNRAGAGKSISYALDKADARLIVSNGGLNSKDIADQFKLAQSTRPDISKNTGHISKSLPPGEKLTDSEWGRLIDRMREELGLDDGFPFCAGLHEDTDHQHAHVVFSRVSYDGRVIDDRFIKVRMAAIEDIIEDEFGLKLMPKPPAPTAPAYTKGEAEMSARTGVKPPKMMIFDAVKKSMNGKPKVMTFIERLRAEGVTARPAIKNGKMSGFSFAFNGVEFGASKIVNGFGWASLQKEIDYESDRDNDALARHAAQLPKREFNEPAIPVTDRTERDIEPAISLASPDAQPTAGEVPGAGDPLECSAGQPEKVPPGIIGEPSESSKPDKKTAPVAAVARPGGVHPIAGSGRHFDPVGDRVRAKLFPTKDAALLALANICGQDRLMAQALIAAINRYDYLKESIATEFLRQFEASLPAQRLLAEHVPGISEKHIHALVWPYVKAAEAKAAAQYRYNREHAESPKSDDSSALTM